MSSKEGRRKETTQKIEEEVGIVVKQPKNQEAFQVRES